MVVWYKPVLQASNLRITCLLSAHKQPLPQQPHQGRSLVKAMLFASFFSLFVLFVLFDLLRELRFSDPSGSSPDSVTESSFDPLSRLDLLELECDRSLLCRCPSEDFRSFRCLPSSPRRLVNFPSARSR